MKNKKSILIILLIIIIIATIITFVLVRKGKNTDNNKMQEYTPQEEMSDDEIRKTIISLYYKNIETNSLIAEARCIDVKQLYKDPYTYLINLLIAGPESDKLESAIPEGTKVNSCKLNGSTVYVDLSKEFIDNAASGTEEESLIIYSITNTLTELNEVTSVKILINGEENKAFKDNKMNFKESFTKND